MAEEKIFVSLDDAAHEVEVAITRLALLHLAFSKTLIEELGEEKGRELILKSIMEYGKRVGERIKRGLPDLPKYGVHKEKIGERVYGCVLARIFREYGEQDVGSFYCYVDPAKSMAVEPETKLIHNDCAACGDDYCTFVKITTTEKERADFENMRGEWKNIDPRLAKGLKDSKKYLERV
ncbi:L-2-amino-thiazoline-4-carboxylic acid hydrolase [Candidatus Bathyarchaeota archaeon]|nr:L-2-amino-thiazoline-4-carboxylic acid hydrolase [Candidatus Bathyarchaeota archaeon]MBS7630702.1 L-2-amino-thiazoline-4-carboxylic acid hydrolase [Candidatus Bathyarchaeota archaeon]